MPQKTLDGRNKYPTIRATGRTPGGPTGDPVSLRRRDDPIPQGVGTPPMRSSFTDADDVHIADRRKENRAIIPEAPTAEEARDGRLHSDPSLLSNVAQDKQIRLHPVLQRLRHDLGISHHEPRDVEVGDHRWSMIPTTPQLLGFALRIVDQHTRGITERMTATESALAAVAIVAIDGVPAYQVFGIDTRNVVKNPMRPPPDVHLKAAAELFQFINEESKQQLGAKLYAAFTDVWDMEGIVKSYLDDADKEKWTWVCPDKECSHIEKELPQYGDDGEILPMYCKFHGIKMEPIAVGEKEEIENPLP